MDIHEFILGTHGQQETPPPADPQQIASDLRNCFTALADEHHFQPGDLMIHKFPEMAMLEKADMPVICARLIEPIQMVDQIIPAQSHEAYNSGFAGEADCVIGIMNQGRYFEHLADSRFYRPFVPKSMN